MAKSRISDRIVRNIDVKDALGAAFTRALHWAPKSLLAEFETERRGVAIRRLAIRIDLELAADGWRERRPRLDLPRLDDAIVEGMKAAGKTILGSLPAACCCDACYCDACRCEGKLLDSIGFHLGELTFKAMKRLEIALEPTPNPPFIDLEPYRRREAG